MNVYLIGIHEDPTFFGKSRWLWNYVDLLDWIRYGGHRYLLLLTKTCYYLSFQALWGCYYERRATNRGMLLLATLRYLKFDSCISKLTLITLIMASTILKMIPRMVKQMVRNDHILPVHVLFFSKILFSRLKEILTQASIHTT